MRSQSQYLVNIIYSFIIAVVVGLVVYLIAVKPMFYDGRYTCKVGYAMTYPAVLVSDKAKLIQHYAYVGTATILGMQAISLADTILKKTKFKGVGLWGKIAAKIAKTEDIAEAKGIRGWLARRIEGFGEHLRKNRWKYLAGAALLYGIGTGISLGEFFISRPVEAMCHPEPEIYVDINVNCGEIKKRIDKKVYQELERLVGKCSNNEKWKNLYVQFLIAKYAYLTYSEMMGMLTGKPHTHYVLYIYNSTKFTLTEADLICWLIAFQKKGQPVLGNFIIDSPDYEDTKDMIKESTICKAVMNAYNLKPEDILKKYLEDEPLNIHKNKILFNPLQGESCAITDKYPLWIFFMNYGTGQVAIVTFRDIDDYEKAGKDLAKDLGISCKSKIEQKIQELDIVEEYYECKGGWCPMP